MKRVKSRNPRHTSVASVLALVLTVAAASALLPSGAAAGIVDGRNFGGRSDPGGYPAEASIATGPTRFIQVVNRRFAIYTRASNTTTPLEAGSLDKLVGTWGASQVVS